MILKLKKESAVQLRISYSRRWILIPYFKRFNDGCLYNLTTIHFLFVEIQYSKNNK